MKVETLDNDDFFTFDDALVKVKTTGNVIEVLASTKNYNTGQTIQKLDRDHYILVKDIDPLTGEFKGEIKDIVHNENRASDMRSVARSIGNLRDLINCNCTEPDKLKWITGTYRQRENEDSEPVPMTDTKRLLRDFERFMKKVRYRYGKEGYSIEYIVAMEPQASGSWHFHLILIFDKTAPFIPNDDICSMWGQGFTSTKALNGDIDNLGAYLSAYLGDIALDDVKKNGFATHGEVKEVEGKRYIKGGRLPLYPTGFQLYRASMGVKRPEVVHKAWKYAKQDVEGMVLTYEKTKRISDDDTGFENTLNYKYYKVK